MHGGLPPAPLVHLGRLRHAAFAIAVAGALALAGCPADPSTRPRATEATPCTTDVDCNPANGGGTSLCGLVRACVDLRCEAVPTRTVHCP